MDPHSTNREDDLSACARRLAAWQPAPGKLDADAMLFAAGRASAERRRPPLLWPVVCALLAMQAAGFCAWGLWERAEHRALAVRLDKGAAVPNVPQTPAVADSSAPRYTPSPDDYFHLRRRLDQASGRWLVAAHAAGTQAVGPPPPAPGILKAGQRDGLFVP